MVTINVTLYVAIKCYEMLLKCYIKGNIKCYHVFFHSNVTKCNILIVLLQNHVTLNVPFFKCYKCYQMLPNVGTISPDSLVVFLSSRQWLQCHYPQWTGSTFLVVLCLVVLYLVVLLSGCLLVF